MEKIEPRPESGHEWLTVLRAAKLLDVPPERIRALIKSGDLPAVKVGRNGRCYRIARGDLVLALHPARKAGDEP